MSKLHLRIPDFDGDVRDPHFKGWVPILSFNFNHPSQGIYLTKEMDVLSVPIQKAVGFGRHVEQLVIFNEGHPPGSANAMLVFVNIAFASHQYGGSVDAEQIQSFYFVYGAMAFMSQAQYLALKDAAAALKKLTNWFK